MNHRVLVVDDSSTLRKVVHAILSRNGYDCLASGDGQDALRLLDRESVDLVLLDFVMPRMNGYQFCRELRAREDVRDLPVVLMSAKAERIRDQFLLQTGAVDAITKPFDPRALVAVVEGALQRKAEGRAPKVPAAEDMPEGELLGGTTDSVPPSSMFPQGTFTRSELSQALTECLGPELTRAFPDTPFHHDQLREVFASALASNRLTPVLQRLRWNLAPNAEEVLYGDIESIPIGEIMQVLQMQRQSGILEITNRKMTVFIHLRDGLVDLAQCRQGDPELLLGRYFLERDLVSSENLESVLRDASANNERLGERLVSLGLVTKEDLAAALQRQTSEIIYDAVRWQRGWFLLRRDVRTPEAQSAALGLPIASIVMEGFRRVDEWRLIEQTIRFEEVLVRDEEAIGALEEGQLTTHERTVLKEIDGTRSIRGIIEESHVSSFDICKAFYRLLKARLVRRKAAEG
jgi:DNA-binding response OmpR family regulator